MVSIRQSVPLVVRARAAVALEREGAAAVFGPWRVDPHVVEVRWTPGVVPTRCGRGWSA
jgi:hypothetical protein